MLNVLAICTGNAGRSILAEALLAHGGTGRVRAFSAGTNPVGRVPQAALAVLARRGVPTAGLRSKSWHEFAAPGAPALDLIIMLCPAAAEEIAPDWPGRPVTVFWPVPDPLAAAPDQADLAFQLCADRLAARIASLLALPLDRLGRDGLAEALGAASVA